MKLAHLFPFVAFAGLLGGSVALSPKPAVRSPIPSGPLPVKLLPNPIPLVQGRRYRGRAGLGFFLCLPASPSGVKGRMESAGFSDVRVFGSSVELPADWPAALRGEADSHCTYWIEATWAAPSKLFPVPGAIDSTDVWEI